MKMKDYYVKSGNWVVKVTLNDPDLKGKDNKYMECATRAFEFIFGYKDMDESAEVIALYNKDGVNIINNDNEDMEDYVEATFNALTTIYTNLDTNHKDIDILSSDIFANASQFENYKMAKELEKQEGFS